MCSCPANWLQVAAEATSAPTRRNSLGMLTPHKASLPLHDTRCNKPFV